MYPKSQSFPGYSRVHPDADAGKLPRLQGPRGERQDTVTRAVCVSRADGGGHFLLQQQRGAGGEGSEATRGGHARCREKANRIFGEIFTVPEASIVPEMATVIGLDGQKMSKSYNDTIGLFEEEKALKRR